VPTNNLAEVTTRDITTAPSTYCSYVRYRPVVSFVFRETAREPSGSAAGPFTDSNAISI
jgi:hypothetical protein